MTHFVALPCPDCYRRIDTFRLSASPTSVTLQGTCHPCKSLIEVTLTHDDLRPLSEGQAVVLNPVTEPQPQLLM
jgi:hypothetical protein